MTDRDIKREERRYFSQFLWMCVIVVAILIGTYYGATSIVGKPDGPGTFGDLFGVSTCLFSGLAFSGLLYTLRIQKLELRITRAELKATAEANQKLADTNLKALEVQRLSSIIAGRQAILAVMAGPNQTMAGKLQQHGIAGSAATHAKEIEKCVHELEKLE